MKKIILFALILLTYFFVSADSQISNQKRIYINQLERKIEYEYQTGKFIYFYYPEDKLNYDVPINIKENEEIVLFIKHPDLFNYVYKYEENKKELNENYKITEEIIKNAESLLALFTASGIKKVMPLGSPSVVSPVTIEEKIQDFSIIFTDVQGFLKKADQLKNDTKNYDANRVTIKTWELSKVEKKLKTYFKEFWEERIKLVPTILKPKPGDADWEKEKGKYDKIITILGIEDKVIEILNKLKKFSEIYMLLGEDDEFGRIRFEKYIKELVIEISATKENECEAKDRFIGKTTFFVKPHTPFKLAFGPAVVFSLAKREKYSLEKVDGGFKIVASKEDFKPFDVAAMITIFPRFIKGLDENVFVEFGMNNISTDKIGYLVGIGFNVNSSFYLGIGYGWHKSEVLDGQKAGDVLVSEDDLKTTTGTIKGIYFHLTVIKK